MAFEPLTEAIASPENFTYFMLELGWDMRELPDANKESGNAPSEHPGHRRIRRD